MGRRQSKCEGVIKKSLELQEKLDERARKREVRSLKKSSSTSDKTSAAKDNLHPTSDVNTVPNSGDRDSLELNSDKEVYQETIEEFEQELINPNKATIDETEYNTRI